MKKDNISVIGIGRLGLCLCLTLEKSGYNVIGCDILKSYVDNLNEKKFKSYEKNVNKYLVNAKKFRATTNTKDVIDHSNVIFVTVRTESENNGEYDVSQVDSVIEGLIRLGYQKIKKSLIINCNVNPGYSDHVQKKLENLNYVISYNPEWVKQGSILFDQSNPDTVVIGSPTKEEQNKIEKIYSKICLNNPSIHKMNRLSAEITKISLNCALTTKITMANMIGDIALSQGQDPDTILKAIGSDSRIGTKFFSYGFGFGGPCFPRDTRAFNHYSSKCNVNSSLIVSTIETNNSHLLFQVNNFCKNNPDKNIPVIIDTVTYKKGTNIIDESQQLLYALKLKEKGYKVIIKDNEDVINKLKNLYGEMFIYEK